MQYCNRCLYPANAKPAIILDDSGVCSGCRYHETRASINWGEREAMLREILEEYKSRAREAGNPYDCLIPVSGGKDSHYQVHLLKQVYGLNPLLVTFNHAYNTALGIRNLKNLVEKLGCDLVRFTANPESVQKISRYMLFRVGDLTWHYHAGIRTFPFQIAVQYGIPLVVWGEQGFAELTGMFTLEDMVEFTKWGRQEHDMRGLEPEDFVGEEGITARDVAPYVYPDDEDIERLGVRGIYLSNFIYWDAKEQAEFVIDEYDFAIYAGKRDRTFNLYAKTDDHANDVHDYLKYLKFGYGRATDDASTEIRHGRMTREEGIDMVAEYDHVKPRTLETYLNFLGLKEEEFFAAVEPMREAAVWESANGEWKPKDSVVNHRHDPGVEAARVTQGNDRTLDPENARLYWIEGVSREHVDPSSGLPQPGSAEELRFVVQ